jgi:hypothetical protein
VKLTPTISLLIKQTIDTCAKSIYQEQEGGIHSELVPAVWNWIKERVSIQVGQRVLDIGPGNGLAINLFLKDGLEPIALCGSEAECAAINTSGTGAVALWADMHEISMFSNFFSGIFARHALEHSFAPLTMLLGMKFALKPAGWIYVEVPAPGTACKHDSDNPNHFSVLSRPMWRKLIADAGFKIIDEASITFTVQAGDDEYYSFLAVHA